MDDIINKCRCCLSTEKTDESSLFKMTETFLFDNKPHKNISDIYFNFCGIDTENIIDRKSLIICITCKVLLQKSFTFRELCRQSHEKTLSSLCQQSHIKEEPNDEAIPSIFCKETKISDSYPISEVLIADVKVELEQPLVFKSKKSRKRKLSLKPDDCLPKQRVKTDDDTDCKDVKVNNTTANPTSIEYFEAKFMCLICDKLCKNYAMLTKHRGIHNKKGGPFSRQCTQCGIEKIVDYEVHLATEHPQYKPQQCLLCEASFVNHKDLKGHFSQHISPQEHHCFGCGSIHKTSFALRSHIVRNNCRTASGEKIEEKNSYNCHLCGLKFTKITPLNQHVFEKHPKEYCNRFYPCFRCKRIYSSSVSYKNGCKKCCIWRSLYEIKMQNQNQLPKFECEECNTKFYDEEDLLCHFIANHQPIGCYCFECEKGLLNITEMRNHRRAMHSKKNKGKTKMCDECGKCYRDNVQLREHALSHSDLRAVKCSVCPATFRAGWHLKQHMKNIHNKQFNKKYECHDCGKIVETYNYLKVHFARTHFPFMKKYKCDICLMTFASSTDKKRHMKKHTGESPSETTEKGKKSVMSSGVGFFNQIAGEMVVTAGRRQKLELPSPIQPSVLEGIFSQSLAMQTNLWTDRY